MDAAKELVMSPLRKAQAALWTEVRIALALDLESYTLLT
jgi:hypothetical protein